jgi:hypothetical protein
VLRRPVAACLIAVALATAPVEAQTPSVGPAASQQPGPTGNAATSSSQGAVRHSQGGHHRSVLGERHTGDVCHPSNCGRYGGGSVHDLSTTQAVSRITPRRLAAAVSQPARPVTSNGALQGDFL